MKTLDKLILGVLLGYNLFLVMKCPCKTMVACSIDSFLIANAIAVGIILYTNYVSGEPLF